MSKTDGIRTPAGVSNASSDVENRLAVAQSAVACARADTIRSCDMCGRLVPELNDHGLGEQCPLCIERDLQNIDAKWRPPNPGGLALRLLAEGVNDVDLCRMAKISRSTLWRLRREQDTPTQGDFLALASGGSVSNRATPGDGTSEAIQTAASVSVNAPKAA